MTDMPDRIARHLVALGPRIPPLSVFVDEVLADEDATLMRADLERELPEISEAEKRALFGDR